MVSRKVRVMELTEKNFFGMDLNHNVAIIDKGPGGGLMMVDTSLPENLDNIERYLKSWGYSIEDISDIVITHFHPDHIGNAMEIKKRSKARIYAHELEEINYNSFNLTYEQVREEFPVSEKEFLETMNRIGKMKYSIVPDVRLRGGEMLGDFKVLHVPGHTKGHIALFDGETLIVGDAVRNYNGLKPPVKFFSWDYGKAVESFNYLINLPYKYLIPYHGNVIVR